MCSSIFRRKNRRKNKSDRRQLSNKVTNPVAVQFSQFLCTAFCRFLQQNCKCRMYVFICIILANEEIYLNKINEFIFIRCVSIDGTQQNGDDDWYQSWWMSLMLIFSWYWFFIAIVGLLSRTLARLGCVCDCVTVRGVAQCVSMLLCTCYTLILIAGKWMHI